MAPRIERVMGAIFGQSLVRRQQETADRDPSQGPGYDGNPANKENSGREQSPIESQAELRAVDRETLERSIKALRESSHFAQTGMQVEMINSKEGLMVKLTQASGVTIKTLTAEEFVRLEKAAGGQEQARGKILDQKF